MRELAERLEAGFVSVGDCSMSSFVMDYEWEGLRLSGLGRARLGRWLSGAAILGLLTFGVLPGSAYLARPLQARFPQPALPERVTGIDLMENLGIYEVDEEDFALCEVICPSKTEIQEIIRKGLDMMRKEMS